MLSVAKTLVVYCILDHTLLRGSFTLTDGAHATYLSAFILLTAASPLSVS